MILYIYEVSPALQLEYKGEAYRTASIENNAEFSTIVSMVVCCVLHLLAQYVRALHYYIIRYMSSFQVATT